MLKRRVAIANVGLPCLLLLLAVLSKYTSCQESGSGSGSRSGNGSSIELTLAAFLSGITDGAGDGFTGELDGRPFQVAVELAVEQVNTSSEILPGYSLRYDYQDSQCRAPPSVRGFIDQISMDPTKIIIIGADCSTSTEPTAELAPFWNLVQISPVSTSPQLSNKDTYSTFLRLVPSDVAVVDGIVSLMIRYDWSRIAVIQQQESIFTSIFSSLREAVAAQKFNEPREFTFNTEKELVSQVDRLADSPTRIIFLNVYPVKAIEILCMAQDRGMTQQNGYLWLTFAWYPDNWWLSGSDESCQLERIVEYSIAIDHFPYVPPEDYNRTTGVGLSHSEFISLLNARLDVLEDKEDREVDRSLVSQAPFVFDAVWTAALALDGARIELEERLGLTLEQFSYDPNSFAARNISEAIFQNALNLNFSGLTGGVAFNEFGDRYPVLQYFQYRMNESGGLQRVLIGSEDGFQSEREIFPFGTPVDEKFVHISEPLFIVYTILACMGMVVSVVCVTLTVVFRNKDAIKLSTPYLNMAIVFGIILLFLLVILFGVDEGIASRSTVNTLCMTRVWISSLAFSLVHGTILFMTWRAVYVFKRTQKRKKKDKSDKTMETVLSKNWVVFTLLGVLLVVDIAFLIPVTVISSSRLELEDKELSSNTQSLPEIISVCDAEDRLIWLGLLLGYKALLLVIGLIFAFESRNVKVWNLKGAKRTGGSIYGIVLLSLALVTAALVLEEDVIVRYGVLGFLVLGGCIMMLCIIFIPQFYVLRKEVVGIYTYHGKDSSQRDSSSKDTITQLEQEAEMLRNEINRLTQDATARVNDTWTKGPPADSMRQRNTGSCDTVEISSAL